MDLRVVDTTKAQARQFELTILDLFIGSMAVAVLASFFLPWFSANYEPHLDAARVCFDGTVSDGSCTQTWNAWRTISPAWAIPWLTFLLVPNALLRVLGENNQASGRDWILLAGTLLTVTIFGIVFVPDLGAINDTQRSQALLYGARPWLYTSVNYASGLFLSIGLSTAAVAGTYLRNRRFPGHPAARFSNFALLSLTAVAAIIAMGFVGNILTRF